MKLNIKENLSENQVEYRISNVIEYCFIVVLHLPVTVVFSYGYI